MRGRYGLIAGLTSLFLLLGAYGCDRKEKEPDAPQLAYQVLETGDNEYSVQSSPDPPPKVTIETFPPGDSTGTKAILYVDIVDNKTGKSGIDEVVVFEDCEVYRKYDFNGTIREFDKDIVVYHFNEGEHYYEVIATDMAGQVSSAYENIRFSGKVNDLPPVISQFILTESGFDFDLYDPGERSGIREVTLLEDDEPLHVWENPKFSGSGYHIPDGREGTHAYKLKVKDIGEHETTSDTITLNYGKSAP